jgi:CheY-like chemotaxis protein
MKIIMYVEGREESIFTIRKLEDLGYQVNGYRETAEAIESIERGEKYDLLLTDLFGENPMDKGIYLDGFDLIDVSRKVHPGRPIVAITAWYGDLPKNTKINNRINKPINDEDLEKKLGELLGP